MENIIRKELENLRESGYSEKEKNAFLRGIWSAYRALSENIAAESVAYNKKALADPDHWFDLSCLNDERYFCLKLPARFEVNTANAMLFDNLSLEGLPELLPGRLFTTRMPRNITRDPAAARRFADSARANALHTVLVLTETHEYVKYAGADLESFYASLGLEVIHRPIPDFSLPNHPAMVDNVRDLLARLAAGRNCLVHCAGGSGRTGMVVAAVLATLGVQDAVAHVRALKSSYVETPAQERFVEALPAVLDADLAARHPDLARAIAAERLIDAEETSRRVDRAADVVPHERRIPWPPRHTSDDALLDSSRPNVFAQPH